jgi:hypothetical protein
MSTWSIFAIMSLTITSRASFPMAGTVGVRLWMIQVRDRMSGGENDLPQETMR